MSSEDQSSITKTHSLKRHSRKVHVSNNFRRLRTSQPWPIQSTHPVQHRTTQLKLRWLCNKIHVYVFFFLLTEILQLGKQGKHLPRLPGHPEALDLFSTWLDNNVINTCTNLLSGSPRKALQLTSTHQYCRQA